MEKPIVITIDGPAGSGKSTVAKCLAKELGLMYLDTGAMYRALTLKCLREGVDLSDEKAITEILQNTKIHIENHPKGTKVYLDGEDVSEEIRQPEVSRKVKYIAKLKPARDFLSKLQRQYAQGRSIIAEGRDMGTVVFPEAPIKFYLYASLKERAKRRAKELASMGCPVNLEEIQGEIQERDYEDTHREVAPLYPAPDAIRVDTTSLTLEEVVARLKALILKKLGRLPEKCNTQRSRE